ncbi:hypothetical protein V8B55DRAFT_1550067 [Mucor lusitanicus]
MPNESNPHRSSTLKQKNINDKSRKFRWSSCFSFVTSKLGRKSNKFSSNQQLRLSQSYEDFDNKRNDLSETIDVAKVKPSSSSSSSMILWSHQHLTTKSKRDSYNNTATTATTTSRRPLIDPTLTPRVKPISIKTRKQPSLLRLSLDAELLQSPDGDNDSFITFKTGHSTSSASITPTTTTPSVPFRSGTLGATNNSRVNSNAMQPLPSPPPPLPPLNIPLDPTISQSRPQSQATTTTDSPISTTASDEDEHKLTLIERRRRRSPLSMPNTDQLTLALDEMLIEEQQQQQQQQPPDDPSWRQQLLEQTLAYSFNDRSRQDAMMILEGKKCLDDHFEHQTGSAVVRDKAQYEAIVASTTTHRRQLSYEDRKQPRTSLRARSPSVATTVEVESKQQQQQQLEIITENEIATCRTPTSASSKFPVAHSNTLLLNVTPETPPYNKQTAPSLISAPSTPNSIDSSVIEQDDYMNHRVQLCLSTSLNDTAN